MRPRPPLYTRWDFLAGFVPVFAFAVLFLMSPVTP